VLLLSSVEGFVTSFRAKELLAFGYHTELMLSALNGNAMTLALPILCALPYTAAFVDDIKSGFCKQYISRITMGGYISGTITACALAGLLRSFWASLPHGGSRRSCFCPKKPHPWSISPPRGNR
jgi:hypothetical protein